jgi:hypothetical protein
MTNLFTVSVNKNNVTKDNAFRVLGIALPLFLALGLFVNYLAPGGEKTVRYTVGQVSPYVQRLLPDERVENGKLLDEPVYFSVFAPPGDFEKVTVSIEAETGKSAVLEVGALKDLFSQAFDFRPLVNTVLEGLEGSGWAKRALPGLGPDAVAYYRGGITEGVADNEVATYRAALPWNPPKGTLTSAREHVYVLPLKGSHELYTAIGDGEGFSLTMAYRDLNLVPGDDSGTIRMFNALGEVVAETALPNDGSSVTLAPDGLIKGVYRIQLSVTSDIVFESFKTKANYLVLKNTLTLAPHDGQVVLNTSAKSLTLEPKTAASLGSVNFGGKVIELKTVGEKVSGVSTGRVLSPLVVDEEGELKITGEGFFALASSAFFTPEPAGFQSFMAEESAYKVLVANPPLSSATFELSGLAKENGAYKFALSAPLLHKSGGDVTVKSITLLFEKDANPQALFASVKHFVKKLFF